MADGQHLGPVFGAAAPEQFLGRLQPLQPGPATKAAKPAKVKAIADANPEVLPQGKHFASQPVPASFGSVNYWGMHAFGFANAKGDKQFGKWIFEPAAGTRGLSDEKAKAKGPSFLFDGLRQRVAADGSSECLTITDVPTLLPKGVEASADPMLSARAAPYAIGLGRRLVEGPKQ